MANYYSPIASKRPDRYLLHVEEYVHYQKNGYLKIEGLLAKTDVQRLFKWADDLLYGRNDLSGKLPEAPKDATFDQLLERLASSRVHMLHREDETAEWGLLLPRVLDVAETLIGPDVLALQTMLFYNPPGRGGQGWHQDSYYIKTFPDTLIGAWIALEEADEENGCLWVVPGSNNEPIYPPSKDFGGLVHAEGVFDDLLIAENASHLDDTVNTLSKVVRKYPLPTPVPMKPGDVLFFHPHMFHRSHPNRAQERLRRSFVSHYCNARSWVPWNHGDFDGDNANDKHILARGRTHLPFAEPKFGTPVDISQHIKPENQESVSMMGMEDGVVLPVITYNS